MIKNIIFDLGGVIVYLDKENAYRRFKDAGLDVEKYLGMYGQRGFCYDFEAGLIDQEEFCRQMAKATGRDIFGDDEAAQCWLGYLAGTPVNRLHRLLQLKEKYHLCLLSNTNPYVMEFVRSSAFSSDGLPIGHYFHSQFISYEMKMCKPNPEIFIAALNADNMKADETIFIDDSIDNIRAAESIGIHCIHIETNAEWDSALRNKIGQECFS